jgi:hypothetical protein
MGVLGALKRMITAYYEAYSLSFIFLAGFGSLWRESGF